MALPDFQMLSNRVRKMTRHLGKWARRSGVSCYRVYDADIPEFPLAIDRYENYLHVAEYKRNHPLTPEEYQLWKAGCREVLSEVLEIPPDHIFFKFREPQKGKSQYEKQGQQKHELIVHEGGHRFLVNLSDYLDTGLFLDHRITRRMVGERAAGKRMLNLFAYTGSFTVYAAANGAASTTTIDLSTTYLDWARRNLELNGYKGPSHKFIREDVKAWLNQPFSERYDLAVLDPPTFSNSKRMTDILDVQRDHVDLIQGVLRRMEPGGSLFFSTNLRSFKLDADQIRGAQIRDISQQTIPEDFRNQRIHYCFELIKEHG
ncbi:MAG: class I SAM-dependent methyltransferase [Saprospirales bacterium]|nr:class I SAM-dependent methyltransferase [Saprospirales bacterium]MBK8489830.1 class I SAM-dependent methyltransferase [Saprospirales bacterium]